MKYEGVGLISMESFTIGVMATIKFPPGIKPHSGDLIKLETGVYKITGVVFSVNTPIGFERLQDNIFDCRIEQVLE